jgi:hypothetical protein
VSLIIELSLPFDESYRYGAFFVTASSAKSAINNEMSFKSVPSSGQITPTGKCACSSVAACGQRRSLA